MVTDNAFILHRLTYIVVLKTYFLQYNDIKIHRNITELILNF